MTWLLVVVALVVVGAVAYRAILHKRDGGVRAGGSGSTSRGSTQPIVPPSPKVRSSDDIWWGEASERYELKRQSYKDTSPEHMTKVGKECLQLDDPGAALFFFRRAIDQMHTAYLFGEMKARRPSAADAEAITLYVSTLASVRAMHEDAPVTEQVREVTHRLRTISTAAKERRLHDETYRTGLGQLAEVTPDIDVSDVVWRAFGT
jgi:hypothetical protein